MVISLKSGAANIGGSPPTNLSEAALGFSGRVLLSAQGNSGTILSYFFVNLGDALTGKETIAVGEFATILGDIGTKIMADAMADAKPGTMISVIEYSCQKAATSGATTIKDLLNIWHAAADEAGERKLMNKAKTIAEARDAGALEVGLSSNADQCGPWLFLWAKISTFVMNRTMAVTSVVIETGAGKPPSRVTAKVAVFEAEWEFFEALNLFTMWTTALGLASAVCVTSFIEDFVYDTMRRGYIWQFAAVLFLLAPGALNEVLNSAARCPGETGGGASGKPSADEGEVAGSTNLLVPMIFSRKAGSAGGFSATYAPVPHHASATAASPSPCTHAPHASAG
mgnify:CR=1 FL=1